MKLLQILDSMIIPLFALLMLIILYFSFKLLRVKKPLKTWKFWVSWVVLTPVIYVAIVLVTFYCVSFTPSKPFSEEQWRNQPETRVEMIDDVIRKRLLIGKTRQQVISLLGEPIDLGNGHFSSDKEDMIYYLGPERGLIGIDSEWLLIWLENDVVVKTEIARD